MMPIKNFDELIAKVKGGDKKTVALIQANDAHALEAIIEAKDLVDAILVGDPAKNRGGFDLIRPKSIRFCY